MSQILLPMHVDHTRSNLPEVYGKLWTYDPEAHKTVGDSVLASSKPNQEATSLWFLICNLACFVMPMMKWCWI